MDQESSAVKCPNCGEAIDVNEALSHQLEDQLRKEYEDKLTEARKEDQEKLEKSLREEIEGEQSERIKSLQNELSRRSSQVRALNKAKADVERLEREKEELKSKIELETQEELNRQLRERTREIRKSEESKARSELSQKELEISESREVIKGLEEQLQEAQRRARQESERLRGEVLELAIEEWLAEQFSLDTITEIKKGQRGADCLQIVNTPTRQNCGSIYYESKRTKSFQSNWIEKFKKDIREKNANIGVLVTESMPRGMDRLGLVKGIWVCSFDEFKGLCTVLRESVIQINDVIGVQENRGDKMNMVYDFVTSDEFRRQVEAIVEGFTQMEQDLESERRSMQGIWKKREKQIEKVLLNTSYMYSSIKGIAGNTVQTVKALELRSDDNEDA